jgi:hypothetical protein
VKDKVRRSYVGVRAAQLMAIAMAMLGLAWARPSFELEPRPVLFVGNSLTYVGNLPAVFDAIPASGGHETKSHMLVAAGATLTERLNDGSVAKALSEKRFEIVVLQERGGDFACGFGPEVCANSNRALAQLAHMIRTHGATPILLGTYQGTREGAARIETAEAKAASEAGVEYVPVANLFIELRTRFRTMAWFASDGMHPGPDLTLLEALLLYKHINGGLPPATRISVRAPIFTNKAPPLEVRAASSMKDTIGTSDRIEYGRNRVATLLDSIR